MFICDDFLTNDWVWSEHAMAIDRRDRDRRANGSLRTSLGFNPDVILSGEKNTPDCRHFIAFFLSGMATKFIRIDFYLNQRQGVSTEKQKVLTLVAGFLIAHLWATIVVICTPCTRTITTETNANERTDGGIALEMCPDSLWHGRRNLCLLLIERKSKMLFEFSVEK